MFYRAGYRRRGTGASGCIVPIVGLLFLVVGVFIARDTLNFLPGTATAQGVITECHFDDSEDNSGCSPDVHFRTQDGQLISFRSSDSSSTFHQGDAVSVRYHPATPQDGRIDNFLITWLLPLILIGVGLLLFLIAVLTLLRGIVRRMMGFA